MGYGAGIGAGIGIGIGHGMGSGAGTTAPPWQGAPPPLINVVKAATICPRHIEGSPCAAQAWKSAQALFYELKQHVIHLIGNSTIEKLCFLRYLKRGRKTKTFITRQLLFRQI